MQTESRRSASRCAGFTIGAFPEDRTCGTESPWQASLTYFKRKVAIESNDKSTSAIDQGLVLRHSVVSPFTPTLQTDYLLSANSWLPLPGPALTAPFFPLCQRAHSVRFLTRPT